MKIAIPNSAFLGNINYFLSNLDLSEPDKLEITTNPKWMSLHPLVVAMIAALGKSFNPKKITCDEITSPSGHYLKRIGLFDFLKINPKVKSIQEHELSGRLIPLKQIKNSDDLDLFLKDLIPLLHLDKEPKHAQAIQHIFSELIRNVLEHAQSKSGAIVCAQYFKKSNKISIGVVDAGIGLKESIMQSYPVENDLDAITLALTPGITGTTRKPGGTEQNAGFGLFLIKSIAYVNSDFFVILSGSYMYKLLQRKEEMIRLRSNPLKDRHTKMEIPYWNGVAVGVDISLNQTQEFTLLLDTIHNFYSKEVRGEKRKRYKKPKFI
jgi:anti-sigma regulatory factor (Ser/Thr protein kinase)